MNQERVPLPLPEKPGLAALRRRIGLLERGVTADAGMVAPGRAALNWGVESIDRHLPAGGLAFGALHEFAGADCDLEEAGLAAGIVMRLLGRAQRARPGQALWVARQRDLYARALPQGGCDPARLVHLLTRRNEETLWALEEALRVPGLCLLVGEVGPLDLTQSRRLQLAAEKSGVPAFIIRRGRSAARMRTWLAQPIAAQTRWRIQPQPSAALSSATGRQATGRQSTNRQATNRQATLPGATRWQIELTRCRGGRPGHWLLEETEHGWREATLSLPLSAALAERPLVAPPDAGDRPLAGNGRGERRRTG